MKVGIVGAGGVGTMAAWRLAAAGHEVVVLEQFELDHDRGSSYGDSRIVRSVYPDALYTSLMAESYRLWDELQSHFPEEELLMRSGGLFLAPADHPHLEIAMRSLDANGVAFERLDARAARERFPAFTFSSDETALFEPGMGYARASASVRAAARLAGKLGVEIRTGFAVTDIAREGPRFRLTSARGETLGCDRLLLTAGPWIGRLLSQLNVRVPLEVTRQAYVHLLPARSDSQFEVGRFPVWIDVATNVYGFPRLGSQPGVKIACHHRGAVTTPESVDRSVREEDRGPLLEYARKRFRDLSEEVVYAKVCLYTNTPDEDFIIDSVPGLGGAYVIGGLSGHGFKFAPLLGQIATRLVLGEPTGYDLSRFGIKRFVNAPGTFS